MLWTDEMVAELCRLWDKGLTANEIAKKLGVTKNAIVGKVHRLCLPARPSPIKNKAEEQNEQQLVVKSEVIEENIQTSEEIVEQETVENKVEETHKNPAGIMKLVDLDSHTCRWPIGDPRDDDFGFCGKKVRSGQTYCDEHSAMAYVKAIRK